MVQSEQVRAELLAPYNLKNPPHFWSGFFCKLWIIQWTVNIAS